MSNMGNSNLVIECKFLYACCCVCMITYTKLCSTMFETCQHGVIIPFEMKIQTYSLIPANDDS